jgi:hypothetical protein
MKFNNSNYWLKHGATDDDLAYFEPMITAAEYLDDMYIEEVPIAFVEVDESSGPWVYFNEQKIPNVDERIKTHKEYGFVGKLPSRNK